MMWNKLFKQRTPTHAGGVVFRQLNQQTEYLVVSSKKLSWAWVLPKGHIEPGETLEQTALREIKEEAGVEGTIACALGVTTTITWLLKLKTVAFYLVEMKGLLSDNKEQREIVWLPFQAAYNKLT